MASTVAQTPLTATDSTFNDAPQLLHPLQRRSWVCNSCHLSFETSQAQRQHMKSSWQYVSLEFRISKMLLIENSVYNLKRRIASLPPISLNVFDERVQPNPDPIETKFTGSSIKPTNEDSNSANECLFCPLSFASYTKDLKDKVEHMSSAHGLFIPNPNLLSDLGSFLGYLSTLIRVWHECLYCGTTRTSTLAIQSHMKDTGHCMLNLEREPELMGFWERRSNMHVNPFKVLTKPDLVLEKGLNLTTGKTTVSRKIHLRSIRATKGREESEVLQTGSDNFGTSGLLQSQNSHQLTPRNERGIQNIKPQQRRDLLFAQKRSQKTEAIAARAKEWSYARRSNDQKHDQAYGKLSWAKGGMHNLLPR